MIILSTLTNLFCTALFSFNVNGTPYVPTDISNIDSSTYEVHTTFAGYTYYDGPRFGPRLLDNAPSSNDDVFMLGGGGNQVERLFTGYYNVNNFSSSDADYTNFTWCLFDRVSNTLYCDVIFDFSSVRTNDVVYVDIYQFEQINLNLNIKGNCLDVQDSFTRTSSGYYNYSLLRPIDGSYNHIHLTFMDYLLYNPNYTDSFYSIIETRIEDSYLTDLASTGGDSYTNGYNDGYSTGYDDGYSSGNNIGYTNGYNQGSTDGYNSGYSNGYSEGISTHSTQFINLFGAVADTPVIMFYRLFNFDLFGTSVIVIILSLFTALVLLGILRRFLKF